MKDEQREVLKIQNSKLALKQSERSKNQNLVPPPPEELEALLDLAMRSSMIGLEKQADHLAGLDEKFIPFADKLRRLAKSFEDDQILNLVEYYLEKNE